METGFGLTRLCGLVERNVPIRFSTGTRLFTPSVSGSSRHVVVLRTRTSTAVLRKAVKTPVAPGRCRYNRCRRLVEHSDDTGPQWLAHCITYTACEIRRRQYYHYYYYYVLTHSAVKCGVIIRRRIRNGVRSIRSDRSAITITVTIIIVTVCLPNSFENVRIANGFSRTVVANGQTATARRDGVNYTRRAKISLTRSYVRKVVGA